MIRLELITLNGSKFAGDVYEVLLPTLDGRIGVLDHHMPLISVAIPGVISIRRKSTDRDDYMEHYATNGGVIEVEDNVLRVLVDEADHEEEINEQEIQKAMAEAQRLKAEAKDHVTAEQAQSIIDHNQARLRVAGLKRRKSHH
ncbi:MAG TPA: ATP synthase F1 subunit epsilon [Candidatus Saccharimonadales bacterium]|nr:ATP synthase F1 subunit epsilon [Candidatus Saccharimonadales bacterium]